MLDTRRLLVCSLGILLLVGWSSSALAADAPTPYPDKDDKAAWPGDGPIRVFGWMVDNRTYFWSRREKDQNAIVFVGDSLVGGWKDLRSAFPEQKVANRGIGGDVSRGVLFRFKEDVLDLNPKAVVLLIGTNDLSAHADPAVVEKNITQILEQAKAHDAKPRIILCTIPPRNSPKAPTKPGALVDLNARITKLAESQSVQLVDLFSALAQPDGTPDPQYFNEDMLHLGPQGYQKWQTLLEPILEATNTP